MSKLPEKKPESPYIFWGSEEDLAKTAGNIESYDGILSSTASNRSYLDIEPNISVRSSFYRDDYYRFRDQERPGKEKGAIKMCMDAYEKVGIIKNVIDLMGDFASQGITLHHPNRRTEKFYRKWWEKVNGTERSERFLNMLYRCGNVIVYKRHGKVKRSLQKEMSKGSNDIKVQKMTVSKRTIPLSYEFLNPLSIDIKDRKTAAFSSDPQYIMKIPSDLRAQYKKPENAKALSDLPGYIKEAIKNDKTHVVLDSQYIETCFYKKDDWQFWANPMINAIIDDIIMLEKMKLADMAALDGAISNIRLWNLGSLEHKILPNKGAINKLRDILASNVGGGTMDLVWGPELSFTESNTQIYKFLGTEKYQPVLNSIYAGLGIPPTLTGLAGQSGGFTNNFISLKTLIERLEYGRDLLAAFWRNEIEYIQKSMGFSAPATLHFEHMILSDEAAEKNLLIQLADRDIISTETLRDRFGELNDIEAKRINQEFKLRDADKMPTKVDPYHNDPESDYVKIAMQKGEVGIEDVTDIKASHPEVLEQTPKQNEKEDKKEDKGGRPKFSQDTKPRKQKRVLPKNTPKKNAAVLTIWASEAQRKISDILNPALIAQYNKSNLRELSRSELKTIEDIKFITLCNVEPYVDVTPELVISILDKNPKLTAEQKQIKDDIFSVFMEKNDRGPSMDELRQIYIMSYSNLFFDKK